MSTVARIDHTRFAPAATAQNALRSRRDVTETAVATLLREGGRR